jgi:hypothetical protein
MAKDWIERRNIDFHGQAKRFTETIVADPGAYGIDPAEAALLAAEFAEFDARFLAAFEPLTRTALRVIARDRARKTLAKRMRALAAVIRANPATTVAMRIGLHMTVDGSGEPAPRHPPQTRPTLTIVKLVDDMLTLSLKDSGSSRRGVPRHYSGAQIFMAHGVVYGAPRDVTRWRLVGVTSKARTTIELPYLKAGSAVSLAARWYNTHGPGPSGEAATTYVGEILKIPTLRAA